MSDRTLSSYKECWAEYEDIRKGYISLRNEAAKNGNTLAQEAGVKNLLELQDGLEDLLEKTSISLSLAARKELQSAAVALLYLVTSALCDAYLFSADPAADFGIYTCQDEIVTA